MLFGKWLRADLWVYYHYLRVRNPLFDNMIGDALSIEMSAPRITLACLKTRDSQVSLLVKFFVRKTLDRRFPTVKIIGSETICTPPSLN